MLLAPLAKKLYPRLQTGRAVYQLKVILISATVGLILGGVAIAIIWFQGGRVGK